MPHSESVRRSLRLLNQPPLTLNDSGWEEYDAAQFDSHASTCGRKPDRYHPYSRITRSSTSTGSSDSESSTSDRDDDDDFEAPTLSSRRKPKGHIPRPPNAFILFRSDLCKTSGERNNRQISQIAGVLWKNMTEDQKQPYRLKATQALAEHKLKYPDYKFSPVAKGGSERRRGKEGARAEARRCRAIAMLMVDGISGKELEEMKKLMDRDGNIPGINSHPNVSPTRSRQRKSCSQWKKQERRSTSGPCEAPIPSPSTISPPSPPVTTPELSHASLEAFSPTPTSSPLLTPVLRSSPELPVAEDYRNEPNEGASSQHVAVEADENAADVEPSLTQIIVPDDEDMYRCRGYSSFDEPGVGTIESSFSLALDEWLSVPNPIQESVAEPDLETATLDCSSIPDQDAMSHFWDYPLETPSKEELDFSFFEERISF